MSKKALKRFLAYAAAIGVTGAAIGSDVATESDEHRGFCVLWLQQDYERDNTLRCDADRMVCFLWLQRIDERDDA